MASDLLLTDRERLRLSHVRECLNEGVNPYATLDILVIGSHMDKAPIKMKEPSLREKMEKWQATRSAPKKGGRIKIRFKTNLDTPIDQVVNRCMKCGVEIQHVTSTLGRMMRGFTEIESTELREVLSGIWTEVPCIKYVPRFQKGRVCANCIGALDTVIHEDSDYV